MGEILEYSAAYLPTIRFCSQTATPNTMSTPKGTNSDKLAIQRQLKIKVGAAKRWEGYTPPISPRNADHVTSTEYIQTVQGTRTIQSRSGRPPSETRPNRRRGRRRVGDQKCCTCLISARHTRTSKVFLLLRVRACVRAWAQRGNEIALIQCDACVLAFGDSFHRMHWVP